MPSSPSMEVNKGLSKMDTDDAIDSGIKPLSGIKRKSSDISSKVVGNLHSLTDNNNLKDKDNDKRPYIDFPSRFESLIKNRYQVGHPGNFEVHIEKALDYDAEYKDKYNGKSKMVSELGLCKAIHRVLPTLWKYAYDVRRLGETKFSVLFRGYDIANDFVQSMHDKRGDIFTHSCWLAYIPNYKIAKMVITYDLDADEDPDEILKELQDHPDNTHSWICPSSVKCLRKKIMDSEDNSNVKYVNTNTFLFTFNCLNPPTSAIYIGKKINFIPFIQKVRRCTKCQRFGHFQNQCRSNKDLTWCEKCGEKGHALSDCCNDVVKCINCIRHKKKEIGHFASSKDCQVFKENSKVKIIMAKLGLGPIEATQYLKRFGPFLEEDWFNLRNLSDSRLPSFADFLKNTSCTSSSSSSSSSSLSSCYDSPSSENSYELDYKNFPPLPNPKNGSILTMNKNNTGKDSKMGYRSNKCYNSDSSNDDGSYTKKVRFKSPIEQVKEIPSSSASSSEDDLAVQHFYGGRPKSRLIRKVSKAIKTLQSWKANPEYEDIILDYEPVSTNNKINNINCPYGDGLDNNIQPCKSVTQEVSGIENIDDFKSKFVCELNNYFGDLSKGNNPDMICYNCTQDQISNICSSIASMACSSFYKS